MPEAVLRGDEARRCGKGGGNQLGNHVYAIVSSLILSTRYTTYYTHMPCAAHCCAFARCGTLRLSSYSTTPSSSNTCENGHVQFQAERPESLFRCSVPGSVGRGHSAPGLLHGLHVLLRRRCNQVSRKGVGEPAQHTGGLRLGRVDGLAAWAAHMPGWVAVRVVRGLGRAFPYLSICRSI